MEQLLCHVRGYEWNRNGFWSAGTTCRFGLLSFLLPFVRVHPFCCHNLNHIHLEMLLLMFLHLASACHKLCILCVQVFGDESSCGGVASGHIDQRTIARSDVPC